MTSLVIQKKKSQGLTLWWVALALALALAYWASLPELNSASQKTQVLNISPDAVMSLDLVSTDSIVTATRREDHSNQANNRQWWITVKRQPPKIDPAKPSSIPPPVATTTPTRFVSSARFNDMVSQFAALQATRVIGKVEDGKLQDFGLKDSTKTLTLKSAKGESLVSLVIGKQLYGARDVYVKNAADQNIWLVPSDFIADLENAEVRFFERMISFIPLEDIQSAAIANGVKNRNFSHVKRNEKGALIWTVDGDSTNKPVPQVESWMSLLMQLKANNYPSVEMEKQLKNEKQIFSVTVTGHGSARDELLLFRTVDISPNSKGKTDYWIRTITLDTYVAIPAVKAETLINDLPKLLE